MGVIEPTNLSVKALKGLHLYHCGMSNCAARVRLLIEEKELPWTSHHIDLVAKENITEEYFGINPKGVVPTLVDDGKVIVESNDILLYLEDKFSEPSFTPVREDDREAMKVWLRRSGDMHVPAIKTYAYAKVNAALVVKSPEEVALYRKLQKDPELLAFHNKHDVPGSTFSDEEVEAATSLLRGVLSEIESNVARGGWLVGDAYSLADISWIPSIMTMQLSHFPLEEFPHVLQWYERVTSRPAWDRAMLQWRKAPAQRVMEMRPSHA
jgi:glutathione S-transferase